MNFSFHHGLSGIKGLQLDVFELPKQKVVDVPEQTHHIWVRDRSGSMTSDMRQLLKDLKERIRQLPVGDIISLGWFSGRNQYGWDVVAFKITDQEKDFQFIENQIDKASNTLGLTCYSDILKDAKTAVLEKYNSLLDNFSFVFFTDGYPNVDTESEIFKLVKTLEPFVNTALIVGYGNYYNKELLSWMADAIGGTLIHSKNINEFSIQLKEFIQDNSEVSKKIRFTVPNGVYSLLFTVHNKQVNTYTADESNTILVTPSKRNKDYVYAFRYENSDYTSTVSENIRYVRKSDLTEEVISNRRSPIEPLVKGLYGLSLILSSKNKVDEALIVIGNILGDKFLVRRLYNAFTPDEYGFVDAEIRQALGGASKRLREGYDDKFLPEADAYCLVDLILDLQGDSEAGFYPQHPEWSYNKIGASRVIAEGLPRFSSHLNQLIPFDNLTWNDKFLNLSVQCKLNGLVEFQTEEYQKYGFAKTFPSFVYRNYAIVKDGFPNVENLYVSMSENLKNYLLQKNPNIIENTDVPRVYKLNLTEIPVMNRDMGKNYTSATKLFKSAWEELKTEAYLKVINAKLKELEDKKVVPSLLTEEQQTFLMSQGIGFNGFAPKTDTVEPTDFYIATEFDIKISKFSSFPSIKSVMEKAEKIDTWDGKGKRPSFTHSEKMLYHYIQIVENKLSSTENIAEKITVLESLKNGVKYLQKGIRQGIQKSKFAIILGKLWFEEFSSRNENSLTLDMNHKDIIEEPVTFTLSVRNVDVWF